MSDVIKTKEILVKKRILFVLSYLPMGGAERVALYLMKLLDKEKYHVSLCLCQKKGYLLNEIPEGIEVIDLKRRSKLSFLMLCIRMRKTLKSISPDIIMPFLWYPTVLVSLSSFFRKKAKIISYEPHEHKQDITGIFKRIKYALIDYCFRKADMVVTDSDGAKNDIAKSYKLNPDILKVIHNPVDITSINRMKQEIIDHPWFLGDAPVIISFGRLIYRKGFLNLIKAFNAVLKEKKAYLVIIGEGEESHNLQELIVQLDLTEKVELMGFVENPFKYISRADIFVFPSLWEGFGNVIIEAMACGIPVLSTRCPYGPEEIITDEINGLLVDSEDNDVLSTSILRLLDDEALRNRLAFAAGKRAEDFSVEKKMEEYEKLLELL